MPSQPRNRRLHVQLALATALQACSLGVLGNPVAQWYEALEVYRIAEERNNPLGYVFAAQLLPRADTVLPSGAAGMGTSSETLRAEWLNRARLLVLDRRDLLALVEDAQQMQWRAPAEKIAAEFLELAPGATRIVRKRFEGGADAAAALIPPDGAGSADQADVDLFIQDERGAAICSVERQGLPKLCRWAARRSGEFTIRLVNRLNTKAGVLLYAR